MAHELNKVVLTLDAEEARLLGEFLTIRADQVAKDGAHYPYNSGERATRGERARRLRGLGLRLQFAADVIERKKSRLWASKRTARVKQARMRLYEVSDEP